MSATTPIRTTANEFRKDWSLRKSLETQGVTTEEGIRAHMKFIAQTMAVNPKVNIRRYRVNPANPNEPMMG